jgi:fatty acid desaturase
MLHKYGDQISPLERESSSNVLALSLLSLSNIMLFTLAILSGKVLSPAQIILLAIFPGSMFSLWTLQILHDCLHGSLLNKQQQKFIFNKVNRKSLQNAILFWGSIPSVFGYYLYLKYGHLTHHKSLGDPSSASLQTLFNSTQKEFEDGDVLFVAHRMKLKGEVGPRFTIMGREIVMSISKAGFNNWVEDQPIRNALIFATSFMYERFMLMINDVVVAITGRNYFFPNKPKEFHAECARYCRCAVIVRGLLWKLAGWKSLLFLYLSETLWSIPPHPACAMFVTNHGSTTMDNSESGGGGDCIPSSSTYAGRWYSLFTLGTNYHCEHHDFPTIPLHRLGELRKIAPEFYREGSNDNVFKIMKRVFAKPEFYACMDAGIQLT